MSKRKLPLLAERTLAQMKAARIELSSDLDAKRPGVSCKAGCSACCSFPTYISILEGILLYRHLTAKGYWTPSFRKKLIDHADRTFDLPAQVWLLLNLPCPLLDKNKCIAYTSRPFSCRTLYAVTNSSFCHPNRLANARFVDRDEVRDKFKEAESRLLAGHKLTVFGMPVSKAILLAEKILNGDGDLEHFFTLAIESIKETQS